MPDALDMSIDTEVSYKRHFNAGVNLVRTNEIGLKIMFSSVSYNGSR